MAAVLARGETLIENAAREPEVVDVANCLVKMGARIEGLGSRTLRVQGREISIAPSILSFPTASRPGPMPWRPRSPPAMSSWTGPAQIFCKRCFRLCARPASRSRSKRPAFVLRGTGGLKPVSIETKPSRLPHGFTGAAHRAYVHGERHLAGARDDLREPLHACAGIGSAWCPIELKGDTALITGVNGLLGAQVMATDLRASVSLIIAGLAAQGETMIGRVYHLDRGFERIEDKLGNAAPISSGCRTEPSDGALAEALTRLGSMSSSWHKADMVLRATKVPLLP